MAKDFNCAFQDYAGNKRYIVKHPAHKGDELTVAAPDANSAMVAAADRWGEKWTKIDFYCNCEVIRQQAEKVKGPRK